jgi:hypothetical protein
MKTILLISAVIGLTGCATTPIHKRYVCGCGDDCRDCATTSDKPGKCACGKPLVPL